MNQGSQQEPEGLKLCQLGQKVSVPKGGRIVSQGEEPLFFYVIQSGRVQVFRETAEGIRTNLTELGPGAYFGEVALVTGQPRSASVEAIVDSALIRISKEEFDRLLDHNPKLARHIIHQLSTWLLAGDRRIETEVVHQVKLRQISWFDYLLLGGLTVLLALGFNFFNPNGISLVQGWGEKEQVPRIELAAAHKAYRDQSALFIDARPNSFFNKKHIKGAINLPLPLFDFLYLMQLSQVPKDKPLIVYGRNISRHYDTEVANKLILRGHQKVMILGGGGDWQNHLFPLEPK